MSLLTEQGVSMKALSRSMEELAERTLKLNKRIMEEFVKEAKHFFSEFLSYMSASIQGGNIVQICACNQGVNEVVTEVNQIKNIQQSILDVLEQLEIFCSTLADIAGSIAKGIELLNNDKEGMGRELGQLSTPILQDVVSGLLGESLKEELWNPEKEGIESINLGRIVLGLSFALATFELADSDDVISRLIGAPITAFLAGYTYTGNVTISLIIGGVTLALGAITELSKFLADSLIEYTNQKWDLNMPSLKEMGMENYSIIDFVKMAFSPEGIQMQIDHPMMGMEVMELVLFGPDFSWEQFWEEQKDKVFAGLFPIFSNIGKYLGMVKPDILEPFVTLWENVKEIWSNAATWFLENIIDPIIDLFESFEETVSGIFEGLDLIVRAIWTKIVEWIDENVIIPAIDLFLDGWQFIQSILNNIVTWIDTKFIEPLKGIWQSLWSGIKIPAAIAMNAVIGVVESAINWVIRGINKLLDGFNQIVQWAANILGENWGGITLVKEVSFGRIPAYSTGGFPEDGLFYANHNELIGQFTNGQTAVVNNNMITTGIEEAAYRGFARAMSENQGVGIDVKVSADPQGIFKVVQEQNIRESNRLQRAALGW